MSIEYPGRRCADFREAISARLDGESLETPVAELDRHLVTCVACADWSSQAAQVTRQARIAPAPSVPDLAAAILAALPPSPMTAAAVRSRVLGTALRLALLAIGVTQAGVAWPALQRGAGAMSAPVHMAHETGAWNLAVAVAFLAVAAAPRLAAGALPFLASFSVLLGAYTVSDLDGGWVHVERAVLHVLMFAGVGLVAAVAWRGRRRRHFAASLGEALA
ncbi:hypothetical protein E9529_18010 [Blastococcus sp. KM273128]|uniref:zf-HC2 domain-containing protein n=1 Tax=Blastococcus sp. KM273128 TaxID=2570314 RepID=UPI001F220348|nr:zf-HC2 domain-containing protein [Blastococcus sp. KM273128]MCF6746133.1 hypothetical protein [Blastococcus sp. KM273128]